MGIPVAGGFADTDPVLGFEPIPKGTYTVEVVNVDERETKGGKNPGSPMLAWEFQVVDDEDYEGRKLWHNTVITEKSKGFLMGFLLAFHDEEELRSPEFTIDPDGYEGKRAIAVVGYGVNPNTEEKNNKIIKLLPLEAAEADLPT